MDGPTMRMMLQFMYGCLDEVPNEAAMALFGASDRQVRTLSLITLAFHIILMAILHKKISYEQVFKPWIDPLWPIRYGLTHLREACCTLLIKAMDVDSVTGCALLAHVHQHEMLMEACVSFAGQSYVHLHQVLALYVHIQLFSRHALRAFLMNHHNPTPFIIFRFSPVQATSSSPLPMRVWASSSSRPP